MFVKSVKIPLIAIEKKGAFAFYKRRLGILVESCVDAHDI